MITLNKWYVAALHYANHAPSSDLADQVVLALNVLRWVKVI